MLFFQYALLRTAARYPDTFDLAELHFHNSTMTTISKCIPLYHAKFMDTYASKPYMYMCAQ